MKILFTHSYFLRFDPKQWKLQQPYPPLATLVAAAVMREKHEVKLFDPMFASSPDEIIPYLDSFKPDAVVIYDDGFNYLTKMCLTNMREAAFLMAALARQHGCKVILSSSDATDHPEEYLDAGADYVIAGEAEQTLKELVEKNFSGEENIPGLIFRKEKIVHTPKREVMRDLDSLPLAAWDLVNMDDYKSCWMKSSGYFSLNISTTRGCPFHCNWCAKPIYGNRYNVHSPQRVVNELKFLSEKYDVHHFWMTDDIFGLKPGWVNSFAEAIQKIGLKIRYKIQSRVDLLLQENNIEALARSGCETVWVGAESGSQKILDAMEKGTTVEQIYKATHLLRKYGIHPAFFLQFGYPGETMDDIQLTLKMLFDLLPHDIGISVSYPLPGTKFYERVKSQLSAKANWTDSDELAMMFRNTYPAPFYKELQRFIHKRYRSHQGISELKKIFSHPKGVTTLQLYRIAAAPYHFAESVKHKLKLNKVLRDPLIF